MSGHRKFSQLTEHFSEERQAAIAEKTTQLKAKMALSELRQAWQLSQVELAAKLKVKQPAVARLERRTDMYVSHLRKVIEAMGGELDIIARFPDGEVKIKNFSELIDCSVASEAGQ
jgi:ribosome-binding protein aMBF1 (putative translation factor)